MTQRKNVRLRKPLGNERQARLAVLGNYVNSERRMIHGHRVTPCGFPDRRLDPTAGVTRSGEIAVQAYRRVRSLPSTVTPEHQPASGGSRCYRLRGFRLVVSRAGLQCKRSLP